MFLSVSLIRFHFIWFRLGVNIRMSHVKERFNIKLAIPVRCCLQMSCVLQKVEQN